MMVSDARFITHNFPFFFSGDKHEYFLNVNLKKFFNFIQAYHPDQQ